MGDIVAHCTYVSGRIAPKGNDGVLSEADWGSLNEITVKMGQAGESHWTLNNT